MRFSNGVAQESLLGLVLFSTFIYGVGKGKDSKISRFVDDAKLFWEINCFVNDKGLQKDLANVSCQKGQLGWMCQGKLQASARGHWKLSGVSVDWRSPRLGELAPSTII